MKRNAGEINALNEQCYDAVADRWLRFPFPEHLPGWVEKHRRKDLGNQALEIGAGNGLFAEWLQSKGFDVLCLDPSSEMVRRCRKRGLKTIQSTLQDFKPEDEFHLISSICSLVHVPKEDCPAEIEKIAGCLAPRGLFLLALIEGEGEGIEEQETGFPRFFARYRKAEILPLLEKKFELLEFEKGTTPGTGRSYLLFALKNSSVNGGDSPLR